MEEKKTSVDPTATNAQVDLMDKEPIAAAMEATPEPVVAAGTSNRSIKLTVLAVLIVAVALTAVLYVLEREGRVDTNLFSSIIATQEAQSSVAVVNGEVITAAEVAQTLSQLEQAAVAQGANPADPEVQASIRSQALDLVLGTALLLQTAEAEGVTASEEEVAARLAEIETEAGGAELLATRMAEFGIDLPTLEADIRSEIVITKLLETVTSGAETTVTEEEVLAAYEGAGGPDAGLPPLAEVRPQIETQLQQLKEQSIIDEYVDQLRADADIQIVE